MSFPETCFIAAPSWVLNIIRWKFKDREQIIETREKQKQLKPETLPIQDAEGMEDFFSTSNPH